MVKYTKEVLEVAVKESVSIAQVIRKLGLKESGGNYSHIKSRIEFFGIDTSHFLGQRTNSGENHVGGNKRKLWQEILIKRDSGRRCETRLLNRALIDYGRKYKCEECDNDGLWNNKKLILEVHHINKDWLDDRPQNLKLVCPNCHSQLDKE